MPPTCVISKAYKIFEIVRQKRHQPLKILMREETLPNIVFLAEFLDKRNVGDELLFLRSSERLSKILEFTVDRGGSAAFLQPVFDITVDIPLIDLRSILGAEPCPERLHM